ncbi:hypothetical protein HU200_003725 [Digitaria exilis]|uniref:Cytochrome P450 n=1 Tax=Digitaria exilis TaxID=1010633 RepID=A0A835FTI4_9POAL|nr:hypothetical protein HU200_003725 [Digitaria exilis]
MRKSSSSAPVLSMRRVQAGPFHQGSSGAYVDKTARLCGAKPGGDPRAHLRDGGRDRGSVRVGDTYAAEQFKDEFIHVINESLALLSSFSTEDFFPGAAGRMVDRLTGLVSRREKIFGMLDGFFERVLDQYMDPARGNKPVTMHWAMSELIRHPAELKKVQDEIRGAVGDKERVQHDDMPKLKYLRMVVKETMRLHPPATLWCPG